MNNQIKVQRIAAKAIIVNDKNEVLLLREASTNQDGVNLGKYLLPGGRIEMGEHYFVGLRREVAEETGLAIEIGDPVFVGEWFPVIRGVPNQIIAIFFVCKPLSAVVSLSFEHDHYVWADQNNLVNYNVLPLEVQAIAKSRVHLASVKNQTPMELS